jgi:hypothetical protein
MHSLVSACTEIVEFCLLSWFCRGGLNGGMLLSFLTAFYPISAGVSLLPPLWRHQGKGWTEYPSHDQSIGWFACRVALAIFFLTAYFRRSSIPQIGDIFLLNTQPTQICSTHLYGWVWPIRPGKRTPPIKGRSMNQKFPKGTIISWFLMQHMVI